jgi:hypothetical protein
LLGLWWVLQQRLMTYYVRIRIASKDVSKISRIAEGAILPYLYDFQFERGVEMKVAEPAIPIQIHAAKDSDLPTPKKAKT